MFWLRAQNTAFSLLSTTLIALITGNILYGLIYLSTNCVACKQNEWCANFTNDANG